MGSGGAPTGMWETRPEHLDEDAPEIDFEQLKPRLKVRRPGVPEVEIAIEKNEFVIGRLATEVDLVIDDDQVSRRHASLTVDERGYFCLQDLGSANPIRFGDRPVRRLNLLDGDEFTIGRVEFTFHAEINRLPRAEPEAPTPSPRADSIGDPVNIPEPPPPAPPEPPEES